MRWLRIIWRAMRFRSLSNARWMDAYELEETRINAGTSVDRRVLPSQGLPAPTSSLTGE